MLSLSRKPTRLLRVTAWTALLYHVAVILWGAFVRATGAGAGCGEHWPLCNGSATLQSPTLKTVIEYTHRLTSGVAVVLLLGLIFLAFWKLRPGHPARRLVLAALFFEFMEALLGAAIVLLGHTAGNTSTARGYSLSVHLINTLLLVASLTLCTWSLYRPERQWRMGLHGLRVALPFCAAGVLLLAVSGAIAALGDTLFPVQSLAQGFQQDFAAGIHPFVRLRIWHPVIAAVVATGLAALCIVAIRGRIGWGVSRAAYATVGLIVLQAGIGSINLALLAPVPLQILHLAAADALWIAFVVLAAEILSVPDASATPVPTANVHAEAVLK